MTRKMDFFGRRLQFQRTIPGFLENLGCLTLSNSKISEGVSFVFKKIAKAVPKIVLYCSSGTLLYFRPLI